MITSLNRALLALLLSAGAAWAAPMPQAIAPSLDDNAPAPAIDTEQDMQGDTVVQPQNTISEAPVSAPPIDGFGTLEEGSGGLPGDVWKGSSREEADALLQGLHTGVANIALHDLLVRLLMTQATPPQGNAGQSWFVLRVNALIAMGEDEKAGQMIASLPASMRNVSLAELETGLELIRGEYDNACQKAQPNALPTDENGEGFWRKLSILCLARVGKQDEAMVGIDLMREERHTDDAFFQEAIRRIGDRNAAIRTSPKQWTLLNVTLLRLAGDTEKLKGTMDDFPPVALKYLAHDASLDIKLRDKAEGRAEQLGVLPVSPGNIPPEPFFARPLASDVTTLTAALGSGKPANDADNAVIARLALDGAGIGDSRRIQRLLALMEPFGYHTPADVWSKLFLRRERFDGEMPPATLVVRMNEAAASGRRGEVVLLAALIAGGIPADRIPDLALLPMIKDLIAAGFRKEARALAYDAVKSYNVR